MYSFTGAVNRVLEDIFQDVSGRTFSHGGHPCACSVPSSLLNVAERCITLSSSSRSLPLSCSVATSFQPSRQSPLRLLCLPWLLCRKTCLQKYVRRLLGPLSFMHTKYWSFFLFTVCQYSSKSNSFCLSALAHDASVLRVSS